MHYNQVFHHSLWKYFVETKNHKSFSDSFKISKISNAIVTGFPGLDKIYDTNFKPKNPWKINGILRTHKIIWAPHHTIKGQGSGLDYSSFSRYYDFFLKYLESNPHVQIAFKPHPLLKDKLYLDEDWGQEKTNNYYNTWNSLPNGQLEESVYIDLFFHSDAMIMDSASFIVEYLYFDKPILFTKVDDQVLERFNSFGQDVFNYLYQASEKSEIEKFISETVIKENDTLKESRNQFLNEVVLPSNRKTASENIYSELIKELC
jgi:CDP-glycerol glycerophosphotransferase (TagB/SpsB family)